MKIFKGISIAVGLIMTLAACEPIEDRDVLTNSFDPDEISLSVEQTTPGGNEVILKMNTPGVAGYWNYLIDSKFTNEVKVVLPFLGTTTYTYNVTTPYIENGNINSPVYISKSIDVTINQIDHRLPDAYYNLVGENLDGKTWVFDGVGGDNRKWWYMADPGNWNAMWWNAGGTCCPPSDAKGKMTFDLNGGANFTYYASANGQAVTGTKWKFNPDFTKLLIVGNANILGSEGNGGNKKTFEIKELTSNHMILFVPDASGGTGWVWQFKAVD